MRYATPVIVSLVASCAHALPASLQSRQSPDAHPETPAPWDNGAVSDFIIDESCNATEVTQLRKGLADAITLADHAKHHILRYANGFEHYRKYFGDAPSGEAIGYFEKAGAATGTAPTPPAKPSSAPSPTPPASLSNSSAPSATPVAGSETNTYFGSDLLRRLYHMPAFGDENYVEHFVEDYAGALWSLRG
ncbi:MAG: hypothetical protein Q9168_005872 [Polycauliona sp. 1 TL-2023]